ncbi:MAG TPA: tail fiber protein [Arachidicoccus sp.]|nr:tail fiber protein [Arachidicoccus sp.]
MEPFLAQIMLFAGNFEVRGWAFCDGRLMSIAQNSALFALVGTVYGGDGVTTFGLPDLRGRSVVGMGNGPGLTPRVIGELSGSENTTLLMPNLPAHTHTLMANNAVSNAATPGSTVVLSQGPTTGAGPSAHTGNIYSTNAVNTSLSLSSIGVSGNNQPFSIMQPYLVLNYQIALEGVFPSRN